MGIKLQNMQMSENSYLKNYNVTDLLNYDITFSASTKAFKLILHNWFNTGRGQIATGPMWCTFILSDRCGNPNKFPAFLEYTLISSKNYSSLWLNIHDLISVVFLSELYYTLLALSLIQHREKHAGLSKASLLSVASCQHCCVRCHMVSPSHAVAQHISSTVFTYAKYMLSKKVTKTFKKNILRRLPHKQITYSRRWKGFKWSVQYYKERKYGNVLTEGPVFSHK